MKIPEPLESERLTIRPFRDKDFPAFLDFVSDPVATRFLSFTPKQKTPKGAREFFDAVIESYHSAHPIFSLAIVQREDGAYMGSCGLSALDDGTGVECYYVLLPEYWGRGYAAEALTTLGDYAFSELRIDKITARIHPENTASLKVAKALGMVFGGNVYDSLTSSDMCLFLITGNEWNKKPHRRTG